MKKHELSLGQVLVWLIPVVFLIIFFAGETFAESYVTHTQNEFYGISGNVPEEPVNPPEPTPPDTDNFNPSNNTDPSDNSNNPNSNPSNNSNSPNTNIPPSSNTPPNSSQNEDPPYGSGGNGYPHPQDPETPLAQFDPPVTPSQPIDSDGRPKTADTTGNPKTWLTAITACTILLRYALFIWKRRE